jgi:flavin-dependent dehydrogenase
MVSPLTGGGIHPALALGRCAGQAIADHLAAVGPAPEQAVAADVPNWTAKQALRGLMDAAPPNWLFELALSTAPMAVFTRRIFFHRGARRDADAAPPPVVSPETLDGPA